MTMMKAAKKINPALQILFDYLPFKFNFYEILALANNADFNNVVILSFKTN